MNVDMDNIRKEVMEQYMEKLDGLLAMKNLKVENFPEAKTDGRVIYLPIESMKEEARDTRSYLMMIKGLNYHELSHVLFTTFTDRQIKSFCTKNNIDIDYYFPILNALEDMRIENYFVRIYPRGKAYITYKNIISIQKLMNYIRQHIVFKIDWLHNLWIATIGRTFLPKSFRMRILQETNTFDKETTEKIIDIIYRYINRARHYGSKLKYAKYRKQYEIDLLRIAKELYDILYRQKEMLIMIDNEDVGNKYRNDGDVGKILIVANEDFDLDEESNEENEEESDEDSEEEGESKEEGEEEGESEENGKIGENEEFKENEGESNEGNEGDKEQEEAIKFIEQVNEEIEKLKITITEDIKQDIQKDYEIIMEMDSEILTGEEERARAEIIRALQKMANEYKAHWILRQKEGRVNIRHAMKSERNGDTRIFKKFKASKMNELAFRIFLNVDVSGSMWDNIEAVRSMAKVILRSFEITKSKVKVVGFNDIAYLYKDWEEKHIPFLNAGGGTYPFHALKLVVDEVRKLRKTERQPFIHIILTDGDWALEEEAEELIQELRKLNVITIEINIDIERYHGSEYCYFISSVSELPRVVKDFAENISKKMLIKRKYL